MFTNGSQCIYMIHHTSTTLQPCGVEFPSEMNLPCQRFLLEVFCKVLPGFLTCVCVPHIDLETFLHWQTNNGVCLVITLLKLHPFCRCSAYCNRFGSIHNVPQVFHLQDHLQVELPCVVVVRIQFLYLSVARFLCRRHFSGLRTQPTQRHKIRKLLCYFQLLLNNFTSTAMVLLQLLNNM